MNRKLLLLPLLLMTSLTYSAETRHHAPSDAASAAAHQKTFKDYQDDVIATLKDFVTPFTVAEATSINGIYREIQRKPGNIVFPAFAVGFLSALLTRGHERTAALTLAGALSGGFIGTLREYQRRNDAIKAYEEALTKTFRYKTQEACKPFLNFPNLLKLTGNYDDRRALLKAVKRESEHFIQIDLVNCEYDRLSEIIEELQNELSSTADNHRDLTRKTRNTIERLNNDLDKYFLKPIEANKALLNS